MPTVRRRYARRGSGGPVRADGLRTTRRPAMGAEVSITTDASPVAVTAALTIVATLECRWSRFRPDSEVSRINAAGGPAVARPSTARILEVALAGRRLTDGWFDPTRGLDVIAAGYGIDGEWHESGPCPVRVDDVVVDGDSGLVCVPPGSAVDLGGIAKGWTADVAASLLFDADATQAGVTIGGDIRVRSHTAALVEIESPRPGGDDAPATVTIRDGGIAVSGPTKRRTADGRHHLIDPTTGRPAEAPRVAAVIAATAAGAEMLATAASIAPAGEARSLVERAGATAWLVEPDGDLTTVGEPDRFLLDDGWLAEPARREWAP